MKKRLKKPLPTKTRSLKMSKKTSKGAIGAGTVYVMLILFIVTGASTAMVGSFIPNSERQDGMDVVILTTTPEDKKNNLQLYTFPGVTYTPTPSPTTTPEPTEPPSQGGGKGDGGGDGKGDGGGGNSKPGGGDGKGGGGGNNSGGGGGSAR